MKINSNLIKDFDYLPSLPEEKKSNCNRTRDFETHLDLSQLDLDVLEEAVLARNEFHLNFSYIIHHGGPTDLF